jgi:exopolyphosphatase / guanosine-5'-triphosphate,3'-diphosphate pyrophosphatase
LILAAIDIGSNAARLLINEITYSDSGQPIFNKINLVRVPLRLGFDVFENKTVGKERLQMLVNTMVAFKHLMLAHQVDAIKACATSAMRDAENATEIIALVKQKAGIQIEVIDGDTEANLVYENHIAEYLDKDYSYLYIDVGGGSTEVSFFSNTVLVFKKSFNIGTIRLLKGLVNDSEWTTLKETVKAITKGHKKVVAIGSGGNINKVFSLSKKKEGKVLDIEVLKVYLDEMQPLTIEQRMRKYNFREDRADVIVPALQIYLNIMRWAGADEISVPKIGLADGLIKHLYEEITKN